ncbi:DUF4238 domain-containing protein [Curtobacterium flaccumfaciens]|uniref:DUF4238 domain-containing protein n=1 Tax=Curtobacterium flaccumfaciens TaxID=2035 RepID=UPI001E42181C|nr:DUF4238 domain-containing protein [Curtobacterium allii]MCE0459635.1 DUF4238 domain-containing protein [Curtobacterium allii]
MLTRAYIRAWADGRGVVDVIDLGRLHGYSTAVNNATVRSFAYEPAVLTRDLEREFAGIEDRGIRAIRRLREEPPSLDREHVQAMIAFLDMHLNRGRYADKTEARAPAVILNTSGSIQDVEFRIGDIITLSGGMTDVLHLTTLGLDDWDWRVISDESGALITGDGAVLLFAETQGADVRTVSFPLSPTQLLVVGQPFPSDVPINDLIAQKSRRWLIGQPGTLKKGQLTMPAPPDPDKR